MRKKMKVFLLICGIVVGIGVIFSVAGLAAGGDPGAGADSGKSAVDFLWPGENAVPKL